MSIIPIDTEGRFTRTIRLAAEAGTRRLAVSRARHAILPRVLVAANDASPEPA